MQLSRAQLPHNAVASINFCLSTGLHSAAHVIARQAWKVQRGSVVPRRSAAQAQPLRPTPVPWDDV